MLSGVSDRVHVGVSAQATLHVQVRLFIGRIRQLHSRLGTERHHLRALQVLNSAFSPLLTCW